VTELDPRPVRPRSWLEVRRRQLRNVPPPVFRAVFSSLVVAVAGLGAWITYLVVPQPGRPSVRSGWSAALGLFAALPIAHLALVVLFQVGKPLLAR